MSVRDFDGIDDVIRLTRPGYYGTNPMTFVAVLKRDVPGGTFEGIFSVGPPTTPDVVWEFGSPTSNTVGIEYVTNNNQHVQQTDAVWNTSGWLLVALSVNQPAGTCRFHAFDGTTWKHLAFTSGNFQAPSRNWTSDSTTVLRFGNWDASFNYFNGKMAVQAWWSNTALSDVQVEALAGGTKADWATLGAANLWELNQASVATSVTDYIGGLNQVSIVGTSVVTGDDPPTSLYRFVSPLADTDIEYRLSGGASNTDPNAALGGAMSTISGGLIPTSLHNLFDAISASEMAGGQVDNYRCLYIRNSHSSDTWIAPKAWVKALSSSPDTELAIALGGEGVGGTAETVANETSAPSGESFTTPTTLGTGLTAANVGAGSFFPLWVRRRKTGPVIAPGTSLGVASTVDGNAHPTLALTTTAAAPSGSRIILFVTWYGPGSALSSVTGGGLTWTIDKQQIHPTQTGYQAAIVSAYAASGLASSTLTLTWPGSVDDQSVSSWYATGLASTSPVDVSAGTGGTGSGAGAVLATPALSTTNADDLIFYGAFADFSSANTSTPAAGFTEIDDYAPANLLLRDTTSYRVVAAAGSYTPSSTWVSCNQPYVTIAVAYKAAAAAATTDTATLRVEGTT